MFKLDAFFMGVICGISLTAVFLSLCPSVSYPYYDKGVKDTHKEAFEMGLMKKEIDKDDKVIYRWSETHKLGYE
jgi:hypothetical protein